MKVKSIKPAGYANVYNMEVEDTHDFIIQGGVIAHNCADDWRYLCMSRPVSPIIPVKEEKLLIDPLNIMPQKRRRNY